YSVKLLEKAVSRGKMTQDKADQLATHGIQVHDHVPTGVFTTPNNLSYLRAKVERTGHTIALAAAKVFP
ncbi:hypothetical protein ACFQ1S_46275, partial [Kibdelosporangium lantanae]